MSELEPETAGFCWSKGFCTFDPRGKEEIANGLRNNVIILRILNQPMVSTNLVYLEQAFHTS